MLEKNEQRPVEELMNPNVVSVVTSTDREDAAQLIEKYGYLALPVVDKENRLVGILTVDDAISILQDEASEDIAKMNAMTPSDKPYFKQSMLDVYKSRIPWLLFLMLSATFSSLVIRGYESALAAVTVLTAYIPMLTDAGGNAGSQSTSTIIRSMAVGDIAPHDLPRIIWRECRVALMCGVTLAVCNFFQNAAAGPHRGSGGAGRLRHPDLYRAAFPVDRRIAAGDCGKVQDRPGGHGFAPDHYHRGYHHAVDLLQRGQDGAAYLMQSF